MYNTKLAFKGPVGVANADNIFRKGSDYLIFDFQEQNRQKMSAQDLASIKQKLQSANSDSAKIMCEISEISSVQLNSLIENGNVDGLIFVGDQSPDFLSQFYVKTEIWKVVQKKDFEISRLSDFLYSFRHTSQRFLFELPDAESELKSMIKAYEEAKKLGYELVLKINRLQSNFIDMINYFEPDVLYLNEVFITDSNGLPANPNLIKLLNLTAKDV